MDRTTLINAITTATVIEHASNESSDKVALSNAQLQLYTDKQLRDVYLSIKKRDENFLKKYEEEQDKKHFFNKPDYQADYVYWSKQAFWSIEEGITLLLNREPRKVSWDTLSHHTATSSLARKFKELYELANRYVICKKLHKHATPESFLMWAEKMQINIPIGIKRIST